MRREKQFATERIGDRDVYIVYATAADDDATKRTPAGSSGRAVSESVKVLPEGTAGVANTTKDVKEQVIAESSIKPVSLKIRSANIAKPPIAPINADSPPTSPIVISIANLDKVILEKTSTNEQIDVLNAANSRESKLTIINLKPVVHTETSYSSSETSSRLQRKTASPADPSQINASNNAEEVDQQPSHDTNSPTTKPVAKEVSAST